ncbi:Alpha/Beta hydrolase protein, partial [Chaetomidium leptoderma]
MAEAVSSPVADEVKPYTIRIPTKHLDLTRQKLELTRLPHEPSPHNHNTWAPKPLIEPLIDYWLESYSWRATEARLNTTTTTPQFRTAIHPSPPLLPPGLSPPIRIHFIHARSTQPGAIPLLLIPPFPLPNLALESLVPLLTCSSSSSSSSTPDDDGGERAQAFHVVIPSLPGVAFSDPLPLAAIDGTTMMNPVVATAGVLDVLMCRLGYGTTTTTTTTTSGSGGGYLVSAVAPGWAGAGRVDERI